MSSGRRQRSAHALRQPTAYLRTASAIVAGVCVALVLGYIALVVFVFTTIGIPLGAQPTALTRRECAVLLVLAGVAAASGGRVAARVDPDRRPLSVAAVCAILAGTMLWGFSGRNYWPDGWGPAVAVVMVVGACIGGVLGRAEPKP